MKSLKDATLSMKRIAERINAEHGIDVDWTAYEKPRTPQEVARELFAVPEGVCPYCKGRGWWADGLTANEARENGSYITPNRFCDRCEEGRELYRRALNFRVGNAQLPPRYANAGWDDFSDLPQHLLAGKLAALYACGEFVRQDGVVSMKAVYERGKRKWEQPDDVVKNHIVLYGKPSMGKTTLLAVVVNALLAKDKVVLYQRLPDLLETITQSYGGDENNAAAEIERQVITAPFLMLDEMEVAGYQNANGLVSTNKINIVERIMRSRMYDNRPTLITTNLDAEGMYKRWGVQTAAVLEREAHWILMGGEPLSNGGKSAQWETW